MIIRYIRNNSRHKLGLFVAEKHDDKIYWGYSVCHSKKDRFNAETGKELAIARMNKRTNYNLDKLPRVVKKKLPYFLTGVVKYFRTNEFAQSIMQGNSTLELTLIQNSPEPSAT